MPRVALTQPFVDDPPVAIDKAKTTYFDTRVTGFFLEVRANKKATYYLRYRDRLRRNRQIRIGPADAMPLEQARTKAGQLKARLAKGVDPEAIAENRRSTPTFKAFIDNWYLPHVRLYKRSWEQDEKAVYRHIMPLWSQAKLSEITREDLQQFQADLMAAGYKPGSINRQMALIKYIFNLAERWEIIDKSPARHVANIAQGDRLIVDKPSLTR